MKNFLRLISFLFIIFLFILAYCSYPHLPDNIITHWGISGEPDGFSHKNEIFFMPFFTLILYLMLTFLPRLIFLCLPKEEYAKEKKEIFEKTYDKFIMAFLLYMSYIFIWSLLWNLGVKVNIYIAIIPAMFLFFYFTIKLFKKN